MFLILPKFSPVISLLIGKVLFVGYMILNNKIIRTNLKENDIISFLRPIAGIAGGKKEM